MIKKLRDFDKNYSNLFFFFSLLIIILFLVFISTSNRTKQKECTIPNSLVNNYNNYSYSIKFTDENRNIELFIKRYQSKYLIEKNENGTKSTYYLQYTDLLEKSSDGKYIKYRGDKIIDGLDNKFLILDYINDISLQSTINKGSELTCYNNRKMELSMCLNLDDSIELKKDNYTIIYTIDKVSGVEDFNVDIKEFSIEIEDKENNTNTFVE